MAARFLDFKEGSGGIWSEHHASTGSCVTSVFFWLISFCLKLASLPLHATLVENGLFSMAPLGFLCNQSSVYSGKCPV